METLPENFCPAPFSSLQLNAFGGVGICPKSAGFLQFGPEVSIKDRWLSKELQEIRGNALRGQRSEACFRCWVTEDSGGSSLRQCLIEARRGAGLPIAPSPGNDQFQQGPETIVIQVGNFCNYACRTCHAADSNGFNSEGSFYAEEYGELNSRYRLGGIGGGILANRHLSEADMNECLQISGNLKQVQFFGGEPMLNQSHHYLLRGLIDRGLAKEIELFYCTNGSMGPTPERTELWSHFKSVGISYSFDGNRANYSYIRHHGNWDRVRRNAEAFRELNACRMTFMVSTTVGLLNVFDVSDIYQSMKNEICERVETQIVINPSYYSIVNLPEAYKPIIEERIRAGAYAAELGNIVSYMNSQRSSWDEFEKFVIWTKRKDLYRQQCFAETFPGYYQLIQPDFDRFAHTENLYKIIADGTY